MSNTSTVRAQLRAWLTKNIRIDKFSLEPPRDLFSPGSKFPANTCVEYPMIDRDARGEMAGSGLRLTYTATFPFSIIYRYPEYLSKEDLELVKHESIDEYLTGGALSELQGCGGILETEIMSDEYTVQISRDDRHQNDWLVIVNFTPRITYKVTEFNLSEEFGPVVDDTIVSPKQITVGVYRDVAGSLGEAPNNLDNVLIIEK